MKKHARIFIFILLFIGSGKLYAFTKINDVYVVVLVLDGLNYNTFERALHEGEIPNIRKYFIEEGMRFTSALSIFPSASNVSYMSIVSGLFPGHSGIVYLSWFDRINEKPVNYFSIGGQRRLDTDLVNRRLKMHPNVESPPPPSAIFEWLDGYETAAIYAAYSAGALYRRPKNPVPPIWSVFGSAREEMLDKYAFRHLMHLFKRPLQKIPRFSLVGLYSFDALGHHFGAGSQTLIYNLEQFDDMLGEFISLLKERGIFDKTYIVLLSDHGMHDTPNSKFNLDGFAKKIGLVLYPNRDYNAHISSRGIASAHIYLKGNTGWKERPTMEQMMDYPAGKGSKINVIQKLLDAKEIRFVVARDGSDRVHVFSKNGHSVITYSAKDGRDGYRYDTIDGDPLEIGASPARAMIGSGFYHPDTWGRKTAGHIYPDAVVGLSQIFHDERSGDIFVIPEKEWVFFRGKEATHGSIYRDDMHVVLLIRGPSVTHGECGYARITDLYPEILGWFGIKVNPRYADSKEGGLCSDSSSTGRAKSSWRWR